MAYFGRFWKFSSSVKTANLDISGTPAGAFAQSYKNWKSHDTCHFKMTALNFLIGNLENKIAVTLWPEAQFFAVEF